MDKAWRDGAGVAMPGLPNGGGRSPLPNFARVYDGLWRHIDLQKTSLEGNKESARGVLHISALVLGVMIAGLGNLVWLVYGGGLSQVGAFASLPEWAVMIGIAYGVAGLFAMARAIDYSMRALGAASVYQPMVWQDFEADGKFDTRIVKELAASRDEVFYMSVIESCVRTLQSRQQELNRVVDRTGHAKKFLRYGLLSATLGVLYSFVLVGAMHVLPALA